MSKPFLASVVLSFGLALGIGLAMAIWRRHPLLIYFATFAVFALSLRLYGVTFAGILASGAGLLVLLLGNLLFLLVAIWSWYRRQTRPLVTT